MADLRTHYAGLSLRNPLIVSSSGLTKNIEGVLKAYNAGAGAVVLKSLFEEQITLETLKTHSDFSSFRPEEYEYLRAYGSQDYLTLIENAKEECDVPLIASINCTKSSSWIDYARKIQSSGADALEVNINMLPAKEYVSQKDFDHWYHSRTTPGPECVSETSNDMEGKYIQILKELKSHISIPVIFKIGPYFTSLINFAKTLDLHGVNAIVLFNWFFAPDFDIETKQPILTMKLSTPQDMGNTLRWTALLRNEVKCDLSATTGVHDARSCIKLFMAGANTVQLCSVLYKNGMKTIEQFLHEISEWMDSHGYAALGDLKGSLQEYLDMSIFSRTQYIRMYTGAE